MTDEQHQATNHLAMQFHSKTHRSIVQLFPSAREIERRSWEDRWLYLCLACSLLPRGIDDGLFALLASYMFDKTLELKAKPRLAETVGISADQLYFSIGCKLGFLEK